MIWEKNSNFELQRVVDFSSLMRQISARLMNVEIVFSTTLRQDIPDLSHIVHDNLSFSFSLSFFVYVPLSTWCRASSEWWRPLLNPDPLMDFRSFRVRHFDFMSSTRETTTFIFCEHRWIFFSIHPSRSFIIKNICTTNRLIMITIKLCQPTKVIFV